MKKPIMNKLVKLIAKKQNAKNKMNAGQIREFIKCYYLAILELTKLEITALKKENI